ncbi:MAG TPA: adenylate/guanylate cyclase domain-containing protein, partial [Solirubrobacteraceae bacterium]|nr:adenylate/guanylate cyclase domain-containing protein [Solirubrobacteraceae bacterium]
MVRCPQCGTENPAGFRFCGICTAPLAAVAPPRQSRKTVTALFCDVTGSTALGEELDPEVLRGVLNRYFAEMRGIIERHGGTVEKFIGDAVMAVFGIPRVREDDALRAVRAAAEIRERLPGVAEEVGVELRFRTGVNTGPVLVGEGENLAVGDAVNVAARLEQAAEPGEIVLGEETLALVRDAVEVQALEPLQLKGKSEPVPAFRLLSVDPAAPGFARHLETRLVGREDELRRLSEAWERVVGPSTAHLFTVLGEAGVGKSRLVAELLGRLGDDATVLRGRCLHYGEGITFWPLVEALSAVGEVARPTVDQLESGSTTGAGELFWQVRRLLEELALERPVVLYLDDVQWAEPTLLDLVEYVTDLSTGAPILLLCTARPELLEARPGWGGAKPNAGMVLLEPLAAADSEILLEELGDGLDPGARAQVVAASEGNPLFLEEMAALARERGTVETPSTIQALLTARLEGLGVADRELLERGAVEGEVFHRLAVRALADERLAGEVEPRLAGLVRKELIRPHPATLKGDEAFRFRHLLIRDAAYDALPKATRA